MAALPLTKQGRGRQLVIRAALCNFRLAGLFRRSLFRFAVEHKNRRSLRGVRRFLFVLFLDSGPVPENVAFISEANRLLRFIQQLRPADGLRRHRFPSGEPRLFHAAPHAPLLSLLPPGVPAGLRLLQNPKTFHGTNGAFRAYRPGVRAGKRKTCSHKKRREEKRDGNEQSSPEIEADTNRLVTSAKTSRSRRAAAAERIFIAVLLGKRRQDYHDRSKKAKAAQTPVKLLGNRDLVLPLLSKITPDR